MQSKVVAQQPKKGNKKQIEQPPLPKEPESSDSDEGPVGLPKSFQKKQEEKPLSKTKMKKDKSISSLSVLYDSKALKQKIKM